MTSEDHGDDTLHLDGFSTAFGMVIGGFITWFVYAASGFQPGAGLYLPTSDELQRASESTVSNCDVSPMCGMGELIGLTIVTVVVGVAVVTVHAWYHD